MQLADWLPAVVIIHNLQENFTVKYMCEKGRKLLGVSMDELKTMGLDYYKRFFNEKDAAFYVPRMQELISRNNMDEVFTFFQQVKPHNKENWEWYLSSTRLLMRDLENRPILTITHAVRIDAELHLTKKVSQLLEDNLFFRDNYLIYSTLTQREKEILQLLTSGKSVKQLAEELFVSVNTIKTHKKNIKSKLGITTSEKLIRFAKAFDTD